MEPEPDHAKVADRPAGTRPRTGLPVVGGLAFIVAVTTILALLSRETGGQPSAAPPPRGAATTVLRGVACPDLRDAAVRFDAGDREGALAAIHRAGREAEDALQLDLVRFGRPEQLALELSLLTSSDGGLADARVRTLLARGVEACGALDGA